MWEVVLIILAIIVVCGIIRVIIKPSKGFWNFVLDIFFLDILFDTLEAIITHYDD